MVGGYREGDQRFCSPQCFTYTPARTFCEECIDATIDYAPSHTITYSFIAGTRWSWWPRERCPTCHSVVQRFCFYLLVPLVTLGRFRVIWITRDKYIARSLKGMDTWGGFG
jgi:hypothetical protein